jgi:hypothetical protein
MFVNDHSPPHVHVVGQGGEAKILLQADEGRAVGGVSIAWSAGIGTDDLRQLLQEARRERLVLLAEWRRLHG